MFRNIFIAIFTVCLFLTAIPKLWFVFENFSYDVVIISVDSRVIKSEKCVNFLESLSPKYPVLLIDTHVLQSIHDEKCESLPIHSIKSQQPNHGKDAVGKLAELRDILLKFNMISFLNGGTLLEKIMISLQFEYGKFWYKDLPSSGYNWKKSAQNVQRNGEWRIEELKQVYVVY
ncbi:hypothetical protein CAEBREN_29416 [Caenorhabditis brenneri]|uniref:W02B3.4-like N-terminal domain-containing protein n=1 Tax=Caenorhabditis brenneri TaxID=135651 RepID=G0MLG5_CAEBE|nr:hypothetical protein CAEBREN_29416 [Caenorhabditis brenneri]